MDGWIQCLVCKSMEGWKTALSSVLTGLDWILGLDWTGYSVLTASKPNFATKYSLELGSRWKALAEIYTMHSFAPFSNRKIFVKNC